MPFESVNTNCRRFFRVGAIFFSCDDEVLMCQLFSSWGCSSIKIPSQNLNTFLCTRTHKCVLNWNSNHHLQSVCDCKTDHSDTATQPRAHSKTTTTKEIKSSRQTGTCPAVWPDSLTSPHHDDNQLQLTATTVRSKCSRCHFSCDSNVFFCFCLFCFCFFLAFRWRGKMTNKSSHCGDRESSTSVSAFFWNEWSKFGHRNPQMRIQNVLQTSFQCYFLCSFHLEKVVSNTNSTWRKRRRRIVTVWKRWTRCRQIKIKQIEFKEMTSKGNEKNSKKLILIWLKKFRKVWPERERGFESESNSELAN